MMVERMKIESIDEKNHRRQIIRQPELVTRCHVHTTRMNNTISRIVELASYVHLTTGCFPGGGVSGVTSRLG